jgi:hypothetical protein
MVNGWNILGFNFTKRDALSSAYKISMGILLVHHGFLKSHISTVPATSASVDGVSVGK